MKPLVSIIIPVFNRERLVEATLESIKSQGYTLFECILVDDGSTDRSLSILQDWSEKDERFRVFQRPDNLPKGANSCRNFGFEQCRGELINWFDSDDIMLEGFLAKKVKSFSDEIELVICSGYFTNDELEEKEEIPLVGSNDPYADFAMWRFRVFTPSVMFKKTFLQGKSLYDTSIKKYQDTEFFIKDVL